MKPYARPLKRFSQNFLTQTEIAQKIVLALRPSTNDTIVEIGPGPGALTDIIIKHNPQHFICVELDERWVKWLKQKYHELHIINDDFLNLNISELSKKRIKIIGNIPYNITSPILFKLFDSYTFIDNAILMIQKEVAKRLTASKDNKEYGIPSVIGQTLSDIDYLFEVGKANFNPQPKVDSAVVRLSFKKNIDSIKDLNLFRKIVRGTFNYRRKILKNSLGRIFPIDIVNSLIDFDLQLRPENLSVLDFQNLSNTIYSLINKQKS